MTKRYHTGITEDQVEREGEKRGNRDLAEQLQVTVEYPVRLQPSRQNAGRYERQQTDEPEQDLGQRMRARPAIHD